MKNDASRLTILSQVTKTRGKYGYSDHAYGIESQPHIKILVSGDKSKPAFDAVIGEMQKEKNSRIVRRVA